MAKNFIRRFVQSRGRTMVLSFWARPWRRAKTFSLANARISHAKTVFLPLADGMKPERFDSKHLAVQSLFLIQSTNPTAPWDRVNIH